MFGTGQTIAIADSGLDTGDPASLSPDFAGRVAAASFAGVAPGQYGTGATQEIPYRRPNSVAGWGRANLGFMTASPPYVIWVDDRATGLVTSDIVNHSHCYPNSHAHGDCHGNGGCHGYRHGHANSDGHQGVRLLPFLALHSTLRAACRRLAFS